MAIKTLEDVLTHSLKDLLSAEKQFRDGLNKMAAAAQDETLAQAFREHREVTIGQIERLERCFELMGRAARAERCDAAAGLTEEAKEVIEKGGEAPAFDVVLCGAGRKTEHYEIASYEDAVACAQKLGRKDVARLLEQTLEEERATAQQLMEIAEQLSAAPA